VLVELFIQYCRYSVRYFAFLFSVNFTKSCDATHVLRHIHKSAYMLWLLIDYWHLFGSWKEKKENGKVNSLLSGAMGDFGMVANGFKVADGEFFGDDRSIEASLNV
jgi:hypothetical protein